MLPLCLVVSADPGCVPVLQSTLKSQVLRVFGIGDLAATRPILGQWRFDVVLCDAGLADAASVATTVRALRREQRAPVVVLAGRDRPELAIETLEAGATDLIDKESSAQLIALRLQRLIELAADPGVAAPRAVSLGELRLDPGRGQAVFRDRALTLTGGEFGLLMLLAARSDSLVHRGTIMRTLGRDGTEPRRSADMHVCRIRRKLRDAGASSLALETIHGQGYALRLRPPGGV